MRTAIRLALLTAALAFSAASAGSNDTAGNSQTPPPSYGSANSAPVDSQPMAEDKALGLWKSSFGAVKLERDPNRPGALRGIWLYERNGQEVIGYFAGALSGNTFSFSWEEPTSSGPALVGGGYLVFGTDGQSFQGKWWTTNRDRGGDWSGWRGATSAGPAEQAPVTPEQPTDNVDPTADPDQPPPADDDFI